ncbi:MAG: DUF3604 domain-containing protein [Ruminococcaceae bacterium]|nr:DUF3604 domain-containing protein [Oscillospiraceae bacterium]
MKHPDKYQARRYDTPGRCRAFTDIVYGPISDDRDALFCEMSRARRRFDPPAPTLKPFSGELHGHSRLSDGTVDIDSYFQGIRDIAKLDFAALTDHDHGGVGQPTLWEGGVHSPWELIKRKVKEYREDGTFTTILAYERDSYPFFGNMILYFRDDNAAMFRDEHPGELTEAGYRRLLADPHILAVPHDTYDLSAGGDFLRPEIEQMPPLMEIISRGDPAEYMGNPGFTAGVACEGGFYQDALRRGARIGCIGGSDDHHGKNGQYEASLGYSAMYPGVTGVWAAENTHEAIFDALSAKRTFAYMRGKPDGAMGGRVVIDFRINEHWMGEAIKRPAERDLRIFFEVKADVPIKAVTLVKNGRNYMIFTYGRELILDYSQENDTDFYYLRVELADRRFGWTSPIWVERS